MVVPKYANATDNRKYTGYIVDVIHKIAEILGVNYEIREPAEGTFGYRQSDGHWDGMVGDLIRRVSKILVIT